MAKLERLMFWRNPSRTTPERYSEKESALNLVGAQLIPDPTPIAPPIGYRKEPPLRDLIRDMILSEQLRADAAAAGYETEEEANDFDIGDDADELTSGYENDLAIDDPPPPVHMLPQEPESGVPGGTPPAVGANAPVAPAAPAAATPSPTPVPPAPNPAG